MGSRLPPVAPKGRAGGIDAWLPSWDVGERHEILLPVPPEDALAAALAAPVAPDRFVATLFRLRGLGGTHRTIEAALRGIGFEELERSGSAWVVGMSVGGGFPPRALPWRTESWKRSLRIAADFRTEPVPGGSRLVTETRVEASGPVGLVAFGAYWLVVGPFSKLIRRRWLRAIAEGRRA